MKKAIFAFLLIFCITRTADGKVIYPLITQEPEPTESRCFYRSNSVYNTCMFNCISAYSPPEIMDLCWHQCARKANHYFFNCLMPQKETK